jgi:Fe-S cluster assembly protein SufD
MGEGSSNAMNALLDSIQAAFMEEAFSKPALIEAVNNGLPGARNEQWKYTSLRALTARQFTAPSKSLLDLDQETLKAINAIPSPRMVFVNGLFDEQHSSLSELPVGIVVKSIASKNNDDSRFAHAHEIFAKLNIAIARQGLQIDVAQDTSAHVNLHAVFVSVKTGQDLAIHYRHHIELGKNSKLNLLEHHVSEGPQQHLSNHFCEITLHEDAELSHTRVQTEDFGNSHFLRTEATLHANASYRRLDLELGSHLSRHDLQVKLLGDGAAVHANGSLIGNDRRHIDTRLDIQHLAKNTSCHLLWRGLATERGRVVFHGGILIEQGADGAAAHLSNKNLLLSDNAEIDTQPVLIIHADEVAASHGATVGRLDAGHLFYLRARGIPEAQAKSMLTIAFCKETLQVLANDELINLITPLLEKALDAIEVPA